MDVLTFLPQFGGVLFTLAAFVVALSIIVAVHEYGHYIVGRWTGIHAEVFSLGFGPVLYSRTDRRGTRWQVAALPFGGYVKFLGDANAASVGSAEVAERDRRRTMLGAPLWARAATVAAGPVFNFILSLAIFAAVILAEGRPADPVTVDEVVALPEGRAGDLMPGDEILAIAGQELGGNGLGAVPENLPDTALVEYLVRRDGVETVIEGPHPFPPRVAGLSPSSAAYDIEMQLGDVVLAVDGQPVETFADLVDAVADSDGRVLLLDVWRPDGQRLDFALAPRRSDIPLPDGGFETRWLLGISSGLAFQPETVTPGPIEAASLAAGQVVYIVSSSLSGLWHMITGAISSCNLSGPIGIAQTSGAMASQGGANFIWFVAVLSTAVGLLNLFPVPILDGGHLVFHAWEAVTGRVPSDGALRVLMTAGLAIILSLMAFAIANDLFLCP